MDYFSIDKKGKFINSEENRNEGGSGDSDAYNLIMKNKEKLLSIEEPTRFIFSHSALREGWDNPNIFQICTLKHSQSNISKRQEIGRGLRICVNKEGDRMDTSVLEDDFFDTNNLTIIASESYDKFAKELQKEILESLSDRPIVLTTDVLVGRVLRNEKGEEFIFNDRDARKLLNDFEDSGYINENDEITEKLIEDIEQDKMEIPKEIEGFKKEVGELMSKI